MTTPTKAFLDDLAQRRHVPWLEAERGRLRLELVDEDCVQLWTVAFDNGDVVVDRDDSDADAVLRADRGWFDRAITGEEKLMPALLRGEITVDGSYGLVVQLGRLLPGPPSQSGPAKTSDRDRPSG
jgi:putative sterol carrier protein